MFNLKFTSINLSAQPIILTKPPIFSDIKIALNEKNLHRKQVFAQEIN